MSLNHDKLINEMSMGLDATGSFAEDDLDAAPEANLGPDSSDLGPDLEDKADMVEVDRSTLRQLLKDVEMGEVSAEEAFDNLCPGCGESDMDLDSAMSGLDDDVDLDDEVVGESNVCESVVGKIAKLLTEDPDVLDDESDDDRIVSTITRMVDEAKKQPMKACPKCKKNQVPLNAECCKDCGDDSEEPEASEDE